MKEYNQAAIERFITCITRELKIRKTVYPKWVIAGRLKSETAKFEIDTMQDILEYFEKEYELITPKVQTTLFDKENYKKTIKHYER